MKEKELQDTIFLLIITIESNPIWRKNTFFKAIYEDNYVFDRKEYSKWYKSEWEYFSSLSYDEKIDYINKNIDFTGYTPSFPVEIMNIAKDVTAAYKAPGSIKEAIKIAKIRFNNLSIGLKLLVMGGFIGLVYGIILLLEVILSLALS